MEHNKKVVGKSKMEAICKAFNMRPRDLFEEDPVKIDEKIPFYDPKLKEITDIFVRLDKQQKVRAVELMRERLALSHIPEGRVGTLKYPKPCHLPYNQRYCILIRH